MLFALVAVDSFIVIWEQFYAMEKLQSRWSGAKHFRWSRLMRISSLSLEFQRIENISQVAW